LARPTVQSNRGGRRSAGRCGRRGGRGWRSRIL
jgi:hypothetical protein